ncbi:ComEC family competence protein [Aquimarina sp. D1M17]|uniref:ComEC/Rec2 family competence protein n=1 Tax=Aquimarina acroporae TaxID=2937283 RepID=UPI0020BF85EF|nr:ComEC/Rec2 family competence protein [Aquimarina acroporae]MCK8522575.1 ComEC family competence protein [Aquimarina acroporae]
MAQTKFINVPFIIITLCTVIGICISDYFLVDRYALLGGLLCSICVLGFFLRRANQIFNKSIGFTISMIIVFLLFGVTLTKVHDPTLRPSHYSNIITIEKLDQKPVLLHFSIQKRLKPTSYYQKYIVSIHHVEENSVFGKLLLQIPKDSVQKIFTIGDVYTSKAVIKPIPKPMNLDQFDYALHLKREYVYHKITTPASTLIHYQKSIPSIYRISDQFRQLINSKLSRYTFTQKQLAVMNALLLGQKQDIDSDTFAQYRDAGAIHILAVSGLHVGIILHIINLILKPLTNLGKLGKTIKLTLSITLLWGFAIVAGLSPSVLRAVTMFSFLAIGLQIGTRSSIYNSLFTSMFILLCFQPLLVFSVGFQLSYLAVFAIVWMQPILVTMYSPKYYIAHKIWETFTVTLTAQLGLLPLTLFYFHQFPLLFFISNLIIIPFLGVILGFGILVITLVGIDMLPGFIAIIFGYAIDFINTVVAWVAAKDKFFITEIPFSLNMLILSYVLLIILVITFQKFTRKRLYALIASIITIISVMIYEQQSTYNNEEFVIYHNHRNTTLSILKHQKLKVYSTTDLAKKTQSFLFSNYKMQHHAKLIGIERLGTIYNYKGKTILILDSTTYKVDSTGVDILLLSNSPKVHLERVIKDLKPNQIIADGSNYKTFLNRWEISCKKQKIPFHRTDKKGAFILR